MRAVFPVVLLSALLGTQVSAGEAVEVAEQAPTVSARATSGVMSIAQPLVTDAAMQFVLVAMLHGEVELQREWGPFRVVGHASLLARTPTLLTDLGSFIEGSARVSDVRIGVRVLPFSRNVVRVPFDFANDFGELAVPPVEVALGFAPAVALGVEGAWWRASLTSAFAEVSSFSVGRSRTVEARNPRLIASFSAERDGLSTELRAGAYWRHTLGTRSMDENAVLLVSALRLAWRRGRAVGRPIDLFTYRDDPQRFVTQFAPFPEAGYGFDSSLELGVADATRDGALDATTEFPWYAQLRLAALLHEQRVFATLRIRTGAQLWWHDPELFGVTIDTAEPAFIIQLAADRRLGLLVLGAAVRLARPSVLLVKPSLTQTPPPQLLEPRELWVSGVDGVAQIAAIGGLPRLRVGLKATAAIAIGAHVTILGEFDYDTLPAQPAFDAVPMPADMVTITAHVFAQVH